MTVDWLTVGAQVVNFLLLVYLLKRFLYGPIVQAMRRREATIADRLDEAARRQEEADLATRRLGEEHQALQRAREGLLAEARADAAELRRTLEQAMRAEVEAIRARWRAELDRERAAFLRDVRGQVAEQFTTLARRALADLASTRLEVEMARVLAERLGQLDPGRRAELARAREGEEPLCVRSAFELPAAAKGSVTAALRDLFGEAAAVRFETAPEVVCGLEVRVGGQSLAWSLEGYLDALERRLGDGLGGLAESRADEGARGA